MEWLSTLLSPIIDLVKWVFQRYKKPDPQEVLQHRQQIREEFVRNLSPEDKYGTRGEAIVRDLKRMDVYPELPPARGISPWFKVEIKGLYYKGLEVFISGRRNVIFDEEKEAWRFAESGEPGSVLAYPVARIPFDYIVELDWRGDEHYRFLHIYCKFQKNKTPYEEVIYYQYHGEGEHKYYVAMENFDPYKKKNIFAKLKKWRAKEKKRPHN